MPKNKERSAVTEDVKATDGAKALADERDVDLSSVEGTGSGGQVTKGDVEKALDSSPVGATPEPEKMILAELNPKLGDLDRLVLYDSEGSPRTLVGSSPATRIMSKSEFEDLSQAKHPPTPDYPQGFKYLLKGREVG
jgi:pyruvate/2-oxoglutarate dehydrogenase complex dihydrolipoamide acyltransferase (E2) component